MTDKNPFVLLDGFVQRNFKLTDNQGTITTLSGVWELETMLKNQILTPWRLNFSKLSLVLISKPNKDNFIIEWRYA